ncbi:MAG: hypothetical protein IPP45_01915 [Sphingomonadales bacterium]|nr:hypothetical protein [Sphingomonadales bacterium]
MAIYTVTDDVLNSEQAQGYFERAHPRALMGLRATLEILGIPVPTYAIRRKPGRTPAKDVMDAIRADMPAQFSTALAPRKPNASPDRVAAATVPNLYNETFTG